MIICKLHQRAKNKRSIMFRVKDLFVLAVLFTSVLICECITGGREAAPHSRPYMASIQRNGKHECGGFLVAEQWVMSAAHCFNTDSIKTDDVRIVLGAHSLTEFERSKTEFKNSTVYKHPDFSTENYDSDIALVKLTTAVVLSDAINVLPLQRAGMTEPQLNVEVSSAGWGSTNNLGTRPDKLQEVEVNVMLPALCGRSDYYGNKFTGNMMCAAARRRDTCDGDSGGPLLYQGVAVGVTSNGGKKCGTVKKPGVYTVISKYTSWIDRTMQA